VGTWHRPARNGPPSCTRLLEGEQILDVRKGGIREDGRHFSVQATRFWLYPTAEHQKAELLKEPYRHWIELAHAAPVGEPITLEGWADVVKLATITEPEELDAIGSEAHLDRRLRRVTPGLEEARPVGVLALRVHRLQEPVTVAWDTGYGGCTSWVELAGLPDDPASLPSVPALSDVAFAARLKGAVDALPRSPTPSRSRRPQSAATDSRALGGVVAAVTGLHERVRREGGEALRSQQFADCLVGVGVVGVEVVDDLRPLVAQVAELLEACRSAHRRRHYVVETRPPGNATEAPERPLSDHVSRKRQTDVYLGGTNSQPS